MSREEGVRLRCLDGWLDAGVSAVGRKSVATYSKRSSSSARMILAIE